MKSWASNQYLTIVDATKHSLSPLSLLHNLSAHYLYTCRDLGKLLRFSGWQTSTASPSACKRHGAPHWGALNRGRMTIIFPFLYWVCYYFCLFSPFVFCCYLLPSFLLPSELEFNAKNVEPEITTEAASFPFQPWGPQACPFNFIHLHLWVIKGISAPHAFRPNHPEPVQMLKQKCSESKGHWLCTHSVLYQQHSSWQSSIAAAGKEVLVPVLGQGSNSSSYAFSMQMFPSHRNQQ